MGSNDILFSSRTNAANTNLKKIPDLQAGYAVEFLVGFINKGDEDYLVESMEASFRYPMDYTYYIQNFTALPYNKEVKPKQEATFVYSFIPNEAFAGRPFGLNIQLNYRDASGNYYQVGFLHSYILFLPYCLH